MGVACALWPRRVSLALHGEHAQTNFPASEYSAADLAQFQVGGRLPAAAPCCSTCCCALLWRAFTCCCVRWGAGALRPGLRCP